MDTVYKPSYKEMDSLLYEEMEKNIKHYDTDSLLTSLWEKLKSFDSLKEINVGLLQ